jgi:molybdenum cofactor synthesis domain-containing protein
MEASVIVVGDEILSGHVQDANTHFIATRVAAHGHRLRHGAVVGDDPAEIAVELTRALEGPAAIVFVCGGLGPTHDDRTMEGVARALGVDLVPCAPLAAHIEDLLVRVDREGFSGSLFGADGLRKMTLAPEGAEVLPCSIGMVPAVTVVDPRARVIVLPGPPRELQAVFLDAVEPRYLEGTGEELWREELTHPFPESTLAAVLTELQRQYPRTSIGSYPQLDRVLIRVAGTGADARAVVEHLRAHLEELSRSEEGRKLLDFIEHRRAERDAASRGE